MYTIFHFDEVSRLDTILPLSFVLLRYFVSISFILFFHTRTICGSVIALVTTRQWLLRHKLWVTLAVKKILICSTKFNFSELTGDLTWVLIIYTYGHVNPDVHKEHASDYYVWYAQVFRRRVPLPSALSSPLAHYYSKLLSRIFGGMKDGGKWYNCGISRELL